MFLNKPLLNYQVEDFKGLFSALFFYLNRVIRVKGFNLNAHHTFQLLVFKTVAKNMENCHTFSSFLLVVPGAATVIIMVCVGFLVVMVILGVFRIRSIHRRGEGSRGGAKEGSNQWDDSALTIIVNPMEVEIISR